MSSSSFFVRADDLIACLQREPKDKVVFGYWASWFADAPLLAYVETLPPERRGTAPAFAFPIGLARKPSEQK